MSRAGWRDARGARGGGGRGYCYGNPALNLRKLRDSRERAPRPRRPPPLGEDGPHSPGARYGSPGTGHRIQLSLQSIGV